MPDDSQRKVARFIRFAHNFLQSHHSIGKVTEDIAQISARLHELRQEHRDLDQAIERMVLRQEHRDLDQAIERMVDNPAVDQLQLRRLKKRKLRLRDQIAWYESCLIPDLDA